MPYERADLDGLSKNSDIDSKNGNLNNNNKNRPSLKLENLKKSAEEEAESTVAKATVVIPPDGGFGFIVMVTFQI